jgi:hypothetical protein
MPPPQGVNRSQIMFSGNADEAQRTLFALRQTLAPMHITLYLAQVLRPYLQKKAEARFLSEGDAAVGGQWAPLSEATERIRESKGLGGAHPINVRTGQLQNFVTTTGDVYPNALSAVLAMPGWKGKGGSQELVDKVETAQLGNENGAPPRPVLGLDIADLSFALVSLRQFIEGAVAIRTGGSSRAVGQ